MSLLLLLRGGEEMALRLLCRAQNSPTFPAVGSWRKGEVVVAMPADHVWGNKEGLPNFVRVDLTFANTPDPDWVNDQLESGKRRAVGLTDAEVDSIIAAGGSRTYNSRGQFIQKIETK